MSSNDSSARNTCSPPLEPLPAGWYGKIPCLGDFVSRRLPAAFIDTWDAWLQRGMAESRAALGEAWLDAYLTGPIWRFVILPGTCTNVDYLWAGVLMPSVDRVGRYFPLTIAQRVDPGLGAISRILAAQAWYAALEQVALAALDTRTGPEDLDRNLSMHPFPETRPVEKRGASGELARWWAQPHVPETFALPDGWTLDALFDAAAREAFDSMGTGKSLWWNVAADAANTVRLMCCPGLPPEERFAAMLGPGDTP